MEELFPRNYIIYLTLERLWIGEFNFYFPYDLQLIFDVILKCFKEFNPITHGVHKAVKHSLKVLLRLLQNLQRIWPFCWQQLSEE